MSIIGIIATCALTTMQPVWLSPGAGDWSPSNAAPCYVRSFDLAEKPASAEARVAAAGWFELRVNGVKAGDDVLEPVTGQPDRRISETVHDITPLLKVGANEIEVLVGNGWFGCGIPKDEWGFHAASWHRGVPPSVRAEIVIDGKTVLATDESWRVYDSAVVFSALRCGEAYDARREGVRTNERTAGVLRYPPSAEISPGVAVPCRAKESYAPVRTLTAPDGDAVYDFGHNIAGWCEIAVSGEAGAKVSIDMDESLTATNSLLGHVTEYVDSPFGVQHDEYVLRGGADETWHPRFVYHGFRYAKVRITGRAKLLSIRARFVHSDFKDAGEIETSDASFTKLQDAVRRSYLSNFVGIPTDCPHREKNGWTGDAQLACETGLWNFQAKDSYAHFLRMMLDAQRPNGAVPCILPCSESFGFGWGSGPAWDAALFEIPRQIRRFTGDIGPAKAAYPAMKRYLAFIRSQLDASGLLKYGLGDWCHRDGRTAVDSRFTDSACLYHFHRELAAWAREFGEHDVAAEQDGFAETLRENFNREYYRGDGLYANGEWTALAAPLYFNGLCAKGEERKVADLLVKKVREFGHQCDFGILGAKWVPRALSEYGYIDDAWRLFVHEKGCGYMAWFASGEDTLWETWGGSASHNHIMFGDFSAWAYEYLAGIKILEPGFAKIAIRPHPVPGVARFVAKVRTPRGEIAAGWRSEGGETALVRDAPAGCLSCEACPTASTFDLSGTWELSTPASSTVWPATVPGDNASALLAAKAIQDPFYRRQEESVQWIGDVDWTFARSFDVPEDLLKRRSVRLEFGSIDTAATVVLNGVEVASVTNEFRKWSFEVRNLLKSTGNRLAVRIAAPRRVAEELWLRTPDYDVRSWAVTSCRAINCLRKCQCSFGWDWGVSLPVSGLYGDVRLVGADGDRFEFAWAEPTLNADGSADVELVAELADGVPAVFTFDGESRSVTGPRCRFHVAKPELWWPNGMGAQKLYPWSVSALGQTVSGRVGVRRLELVREKDAEGESFGFRVNGKDFFTVGVDWIPADAFPSRRTPERIRSLLESARDANANCVRVWGGGVYEQEAFYDACDELGLLVWQDFMFACSRYPARPDFLAEIAAEAEYQVKRLNRHSSILLWCGDNECIAAVREPCKYRADWIAWNGVLSRAVAAYAQKGMIWWPSSPCAGPGIFTYNELTGDSGDTHYWGVWHGSRDFDGYRMINPRFVSEFGYQSLSSLPTVKSFALEGDFDTESRVMLAHQKNDGGNARIGRMMAKLFPEPKDFVSRLYLSQVQQALAIETAVAYWKSLWPRCRGAVVWQLNDWWPVASWSSLEYDGRWKPLHYALRRCFAVGYDAKGRDAELRNLDFRAKRPNANVRIVSVTGRADGAFDVRVAADAKALFVWLEDATDPATRFDDNLVDLEPGERVFVCKPGAATTAEALRDRLSVRDLSGSVK